MQAAVRVLITHGSLMFGGELEENEMTVVESVLCHLLWRENRRASPIERVEIEKSLRLMDDQIALRGRLMAQSSTGIAPISGSGSGPTEKGKS